MTADISAILLVLILAAFVWSAVGDAIRFSRMTPEQRAERRALQRRAAAAGRLVARWGIQNTTLVCPHCQTKGQVRTMPTKRKRGISGAKATGALLTGGTSLLVTGLSRKEGVTQAHCDHCGSTWDF